MNREEIILRRVGISIGGIADELLTHLGSQEMRVNLVRKLDSFTTWWFEYRLEPRHEAVSAFLEIVNKGDSMPTEINIDTTGEVASLKFTDRLQEVTSPPMSTDGVTPVNVAYTSDNTGVATVDPVTGDLSEVAAGTVNIGADVTDGVTGAQALEPDGTPFTPSPVNVTVDPGAAVGDVFTVTGSVPAPEPAPSPAPAPSPEPAPDVPPAPAPDVPPVPPAGP